MPHLRHGGNLANAALQPRQNRIATATILDLFITASALLSLFTMNVVQTRPSRNRVVEEKSSKKGQTVDFYQEIPQYELSLDEFEEYALARLKVCISKVL